MTQPNRMPQRGLKPKDLMGIPWRVAFALQDDGWWLRQDIVWAKPNPMPESVTDRCTKSHEYLFLLSKSQRYHFDQEAILEPISAATVERLSQPALEEQLGSLRVPGKINGPMKAVSRSGNAQEGVRNKRSVWTVTTIPFSEAHFATFPPALIEPCVKAGTSEKGCCARCGSPWARLQERTVGGVSVTVPAQERFARRPDGAPLMGDNAFTQDETERGSFAAKNGVVRKADAGWAASCECGAGVTPCTVLDPFGGAGTTGLVADRLGRDAVLIEINPEYADMAQRRIEKDAGLFASVAAE
jgi:hypothetical protein